MIWPHRLSSVSALLRPARRRLHTSHVSSFCAAAPVNLHAKEVLIGNFTSLKDATPEEFRKAMTQFGRTVTPQSQTQRILQKLESTKAIQIGNMLDLYDHGLQSATRAFRDGADEETVVVALLHDIGELDAPNNHGEVCASLLRPYISPKNYWTLIHHEIFQAFYYQDAAGLTMRNTRERFRDHKYFAACEEFCERWDQPAFDPEYENLPLEHFAPMVERVLSRKPYWFTDELDELSEAKADIAGGYPQHL